MLLFRLDYHLSASEVLRQEVREPSVAAFTVFAVSAVSVTGGTLAGTVKMAGIGVARGVLELISGLVWSSAMAGSACSWVLPSRTAPGFSSEGRQSSTSF
jgi:hypothetical protein